MTLAESSAAKFQRLTQGGLPQGVASDGVNFHAVDTHAIDLTPVGGNRKNGHGEANAVPIDISSLLGRDVPVGIDLHVVPIAAASKGQDLIEPELDPATVAKKKSDLRGRLDATLRRDRRELQQRNKLDAEVATFTQRLRTEKGLRESVEAAIEQLPGDEQRVIHQILSESREMRVARVMEEIECLKEAKERADEIRASKVSVVGRGWMDRVIVTEEGIKLFTSGARHDEEPDGMYGWRDIEKGRIQLRVVPRDTDALQGLFRQFLGKRIDPTGTVEIIDTRTGKTFNLMGVSRPSEFVDNLVRTAGIFATAEEAKERLVRILADDPKILGDA